MIIDLILLLNFHLYLHDLSLEMILAFQAQLLCQDLVVLMAEKIGFEWLFSQKDLIRGEEIDALTSNTRMCRLLLLLLRLRSVPHGSEVLGHGQDLPTFRIVSVFEQLLCDI